MSGPAHPRRRRRDSDHGQVMRGLLQDRAELRRHAHQVHGRRSDAGRGRVRQEERQGRPGRHGHRHRFDVPAAGLRPGGEERLHRQGRRRVRPRRLGRPGGEEGAGAGHLVLRLEADDQRQQGVLRPAGHPAQPDRPLHRGRSDRARHVDRERDPGDAPAHRARPADPELLPARADHPARSRLPVQPRLLDAGRQLRTQPATRACSAVSSAASPASSPATSSTRWPRSSATWAAAASTATSPRPWCRPTSRLSAPANPSAPP